MESGQQGQRLELYSHLIPVVPVNRMYKVWMMLKLVISVGDCNESLSIYRGIWPIQLVVGGKGNIIKEGNSP